MKFEYRPYRRKTDYKVSGVITKICINPVSLQNEVYNEPVGFVFKTLDPIPKKLYFNIRQNTIDEGMLVELKLVVVNFWIESVEYKEKWYNNLCTNNIELYKE